MRHRYSVPITFLFASTIFFAGRSAVVIDAADIVDECASLCDDGQLDRPVIPASLSGGNFKSLIETCLDDDGEMDAANCPYDGSISCWDTSEITSMIEAFYAQRTFDKPLCWNTSQVTIMDYMFSNADVFNRDLDHWDISKVEGMYYMLDDAREFNQCLSTWADKKHPDLDNTDMFVGTSCSSTPEFPEKGPWCRDDRKCVCKTTKKRRCRCKDKNGKFGIEGKTKSKRCKWVAANTQNPNKLKRLCRKNSTSKNSFGGIQKVKDLCPRVCGACISSSDSSSSSRD